MKIKSLKVGVVTPDDEELVRGDGKSRREGPLQGRVFCVGKGVAGKVGRVGPLIVKLNPIA